MIMRGDVLETCLLCIAALFSQCKVLMQYAFLETLDYPRCAFS